MHNTWGKLYMDLVMVLHACNISIQKKRKEDCEELEVIQNYIVRACL